MLAKRQIVLWSILVGLFVAFYWFFSQRAEPPFEQPPVEPPVPTPWGEWATTGLLFVLCVAVVVVVSLRGRRWAELNNRGAALMQQGEVAQAAVQFELASAKALQKVHRVLSSYNLGIARMYEGRAGEALALLRKVGGTSAFRYAGGGMYFRALPYHLATCHALLGDLPEARAMFEEGERRRGKAVALGTLLPEILVLCREGHFGAAAKVLESRQRAADMIGGIDQKMLRILRGFALDALDPVANAKAVAEAIAGAKPLAPTDIQMLAASWPKMREFLVAQKLAA